LYPRPSVDFVSYAYPPLYYWVSAAVTRVVGPGFFALRLVSFSASLGTMGVLATAARHHTGRWLAGLVAAAIFAAGFVVTGSFYDVARVDSLFVFLVVSSLVIVARSSSVRAGLLGGVV